VLSNGVGRWVNPDIKETWLTIRLTDLKKEVRKKKVELTKAAGLN